MNAPPAIELDRLTRSFGTKRAIDDLQLSVPQGSIFGFLGPNGAGKSTTLGILSGLDFPTSGTARILGHDVVSEANAVRRSIGVLPDVPGFYPWMTAEMVLSLAGQLFDIPSPELRRRIEIVLDLSGLTGVDTPVGGFSRGMKQRLGIAQALIDAPPVLLLDEPTSALDPLGRRDVLDVIAALEGRTTVFFSSHILADVERVCDRVAILDQGRILLESSMNDLKRSSTAQRLTAELADGVQASSLAARLRSEPWVLSVDQRADQVIVTASDLEAAQHRIPSVLSELDLALRRFTIEERSLEDVFIDLVRPEE